MNKAVNIDLTKKPFALKHNGKEAIIKNILASRGALVTAVTLFGETRSGQPITQNWLLADAPDNVRELVNEAFSVAYERGAK